MRELLCVVVVLPPISTWTAQHEEARGRMKFLFPMDLDTIMIIAWT